MTSIDEFAPVAPRPLPRKEDCVFYHSMSFPDGDSIDGAWDIRGLFEQYIGNYPVRGKTVLDVGTAGGFLAFEAEKAGAKVTALDVRSAAEFQRVPFGGSLYQRDREAFAKESEPYVSLLHGGFWYAWNRLDSNVEVVYAPLARLPYWKRRFDVVFAGAILEHLSDPVAMLANMAELADEAIIIAFTFVLHSREQYMETSNDWSDPNFAYTFWKLSRGLYERVLGNLGFDVEFIPAKARANGQEHTRDTIVARRRKR